MFDLVEFERLCGQRSYLSSVAKWHMGTAYQCQDVDDVISAALLVTWQNRDRIEMSTKGFLIVCVSRAAAQWCEKQISRRRFLGNQLDNEIVFGLKNDMIAFTQYGGAFIDYRTPESDLLERERFEVVDKASRKLHHVKRKSFDEFRERGYTNETHAQECNISRCRAAIRKILVKQKVMKAAA